MYTLKKNIDELDSVRGIAILLVFFFHATPYINIKIGFVPDILSSFITAGHTGVTLFYILSALLISRPYLMSRDSNILPSTSNFYLKRILRIVPLYVVMVVIALFVHADFCKFLKALFIIWGVNGDSLQPFSNVWWAIYTEVQFYLIMPIVGYLFLNKRRRLILLILVFAYFIFYFCMQMGVIIKGEPIYMRLLHSLVGRGYIFIIGILLSWFILKNESKLKSVIGSKYFHNGGGDLLFVLIILTIGLLLKWVSSTGYWNAEGMIFNWHFLEAMLWSLFVIAILFFPLRIKPLFINIFMEKIGLISFSVFLIHMPVIYYGLKLISKVNAQLNLAAFNPIIILLILFILTMVLSSITYKFIEKPFLAIKNKL